MNVATLTEWLLELPGDYEICLSEYVFVETEGPVSVDNDFYIVVLDKPIVGICKNDEDKEIRFLLQGKDIAEERGDYIKDIIKDKIKD